MPEVPVKLEIDLATLNDTRPEYCIYNLCKICTEEAVTFTVDKDKKRFYLRKNGGEITIHNVKFAVDFYVKMQRGDAQVDTRILRFNPPFTEERVRFWFRDTFSKHLKITIARLLSKNAGGR